VVAIYKVTSWLTVGANGDYGTEDGTSLVTPGETAKWWGGAGYLKLEAPAGYGVALRGEFFRDEGGTRTGLGVPVTVYEGTITPYYKFANRFGIRLELRIDGSRDALFPKKDGSLGNAQPTLAQIPVRLLRERPAWSWRRRDHGISRWTPGSSRSCSRSARRWRARSS